MHFEKNKIPKKYGLQSMFPANPSVSGFMESRGGFVKTTGYKGYLAIAGLTGITALM